ncbi:MAG: phage tail tape measure protein [Burkholderiales bacterium]|nr:phage tail tape measure protein [Burkholderiales bacterium]
MSLESITSFLHKAWLGTTNLVLGLAGMACLWLGVFSLWSGKDLSAAATGLTAGLVLLLAASIERFEVLKGLGMEARTRKLDEAISQTTATLAQLREWAEMSSDLFISMASNAGRFDAAPTTEEAYEIAERVRQNLKSIGSSEEVIKKTMSPWVSITSGDLARKLLDDVQKKVDLGVQHWDIQLRNYPMPVAAGDPEHQLILDNRNRYLNYQTQHLRRVHEWPIGTHSTELRRIVESVPLLDETDRKELREMISPWLPRLDFLAINCNLSDKEAWFAYLREEPDTISKLLPK